MFVVFACIGFTINVVASRTPCVLALISTVLQICLGIASPIDGTDKMDVEVGDETVEQVA